MGQEVLIKAGNPMKLEPMDGPCVIQQVCASETLDVALNQHTVGSDSASVVSFRSSVVDCELRPRVYDVSHLLFLPDHSHSSFNRLIRSLASGGEECKTLLALAAPAGQAFARGPRFHMDSLALATWICSSSKQSSFDLSLLTLLSLL
jgi:hypothetical protein